MLAAGTLTVVVTGHHKKGPLAVGRGAFVKALINRIKYKLADFRNVAAAGQHPGSGRHDFIGGNIVGDFDQYGPFKGAR